MSDASTSALHIVDGEDLRFFEPRLIGALDAYVKTVGASLSRTDAVVAIVEGFLTSVGLISSGEQPGGLEGLN